MQIIYLDLGENVQYRRMIYAKMKEYIGMMMKVERVFNMVPSNTQRRTKRDRWSPESSVKQKARTRACSRNTHGTEGDGKWLYTKQSRTALRGTMDGRQVCTWVFGEHWND